MKVNSNENQTFGDRPDRSADTDPAQTRLQAFIPGACSSNRNEPSSTDREDEKTGNQWGDYRLLSEF